LWAVKLHRISLEMVGLWPKLNKCNKKNLWLEIWDDIIFVLLIFVSNVPMIYTVIEVWGNMISVINSLRTTLAMLIVSVKYVIIRWKQTSISRII